MLGGVSGHDHPPPDEATVSVPWIGPRYRRGGVAAVAINFHAYGGLGCPVVDPPGSERQAARGKPQALRLPRRLILALAHASLDGEPLEEAPDPRRVADAWDRSAFLEAVKCVPRHPVEHADRCDAA